MATTILSTKADIISDHTAPNEISPSLIGEKARRLLELSDCAHSSSFRVPRFCILPGSYCEEYDRKRGGAPPIAYPPLPAPNSIPQPAINYFENFYALHADTLEHWATKLDPLGRPFVRSSVTLDVGMPLSFAGVNYSLQPPVSSLGKSYLSYSVPRVLAGLYRPYSELYLRRYSLHRQSRSASLILCEPVNNLEMYAIAHIVEGIVYTQCNEFENLRSDSSPYGLNFPLEVVHKSWEGYWKEDARGERLRHALTDLVAYLGGTGFLEVEFSFDKEGRLFFFQYRPLYPAYHANGREIDLTWRDPGCASTPLGVPIHHTVGRVRGSLYSLLNAMRTLEVARRVLEEIDHSQNSPIWLVHCDDPRKYDAFALLWTLGLISAPGPLRIILAQPRPRQIMHMLTALLEDSAFDFVAQIYADDVASLPSGAVADVCSNGLCAVVQILDGDWQSWARFDGEQ
jgi:hypothetical protein